LHPAYSLKHKTMNSGSQNECPLNNHHKVHLG
jgi:hypothetical protein